MTSLPQAKERTAADHAKCFARSVVDALAEEAARLGIHFRTLERAKQELGVVSQQRREEGRNVWYWGLGEYEVG